MTIASSAACTYHSWTGWVLSLINSATPIHGSPAFEEDLFRAWSCIAWNQAHRPLHHLQPHLLKIGTLPDRLNVAETVVENPAFAVGLRPDDGETVFGPFY